MKRFVLYLGTLLILVGALAPLQATAQDGQLRLFFLHHSTGRNLLEEGGAREHLDDINGAKGTQHVLWDHDYNYIGLADVEGDLLGYDYSVPNDNTDPDGLHRLWTTNNTARDSILSRYDIIAFKSCYPASAIGSDAELEERKEWYREMRDFFDLHPEKIFVVMSQPPLHRLTTNTAEADRARAFADWLGTSEYLDGHPNVVYFDFFDYLAAADDGSATRNMLRYEYERSHSNSDSHPNSTANQAVAPHFVEFLVEAGSGSLAPVADLQQPVSLAQNHPNPFNPSTTIAFTLSRDLPVQLDVLDVRGHRVNELYVGTLSSGSHAVVWNGRDARGEAVGSGVYFYRLTAGNEVQTGKMILAK